MILPQIEALVSIGTFCHNAAETYLASRLSLLPRAKKGWVGE